MVRSCWLLLLLFSANLLAADSAVDIDSAGALYLAAGMRAQVQASLGPMPAKIRGLFASEPSAKLSDSQLAAVTAAAKRGFRIDVFEPPALAAFAANLDPRTVKKSLAFLSSDVGKRMVKADVALAELDEATIDKVASGGQSAPSTPKREALLARLGEAEQSTTTAVQIYLSIGKAIAVGNALGSGLDLEAARQAVEKTANPAAAQNLQESLKVPLARYLAYGYRDLSDRDLEAMLSFLESNAGKTYVHASIAALSAGYAAMGMRSGERIGASWRELARARQADEPAPPDALTAPMNPP